MTSPVCERCQMPLGSDKEILCAKIEQLRAALTEITEWTDKSPQGDWLAHQLLKNINETARDALASSAGRTSGSAAP